MPLIRQCIWCPILILLSACVPAELAPYVYDTSPFSQETQAKGNAHCAALYGNAQFNQLKGKMPIMPNDIPTRAMIHNGLAPTDTEIASIQMLESATRNCTKLRAAAGVPTSATEDILAARLSKLRYGLYKGQIPYAVYNYGVAQAMRKNNAFILSSEQDLQKGTEIGDERQRQAIKEMQNNISSFNNSSIPDGVWVCRGAMCY